MATKTKAVPVSERALLARINRKMGKDQEAVRRCRPDARGYSELGDYYSVDYGRNAVIDKHIDLEALGRELGVLTGYESLAAD